MSKSKTPRISSIDFSQTLPHLRIYSDVQLGTQANSVAAGLRRAYMISADSQDPSTKVGACLNSYATLFQKDFWLCACNHLVAGTQLDLQADVDPEQLRRQKYECTCHAQAAVLSVAGRMGVPTRNATLFAPWAACINCAKLIIEAQLYQVWTHKQALDRTPQRWQAQVYKAYDMMAEAGVVVKAYDGPINSCTSLMDGIKWNP